MVLANNHADVAYCNDDGVVRLRSPSRDNADYS